MNAPARWSVFVGVVAVLLPPVAFAAANRLRSVTLIEADVAASCATLLGFAAVFLARRGRRASERTLGRIGGDSLVRVGRALGLLGVWIGVTAGLALGFYALLQTFG